MKNTKFMACVMALLFSFAISCEKNDGTDPTPTPEPTPESYFEKEGLVPHYGVDQFQENVAYLGGLKSSDLPWVRARSGKRLTTDVNDAKILILGNSVIDENKDVLEAAYKEGKFIILCNPDIEKLKSLRNELGWVFIIPGKLPSNDFAICFAPRNSFLLTPPLQGDTTAVTSGTDKKIDMNDAKYANSSVFTATRGLTQFIQRYKKSLPGDTKATVEAPELSASINTLRYSRSVDYDYSVCVRGRYFAVFIGMAFDLKVYPCYIPDGVNNHGDYYNVEATATNYAPTMYEYKDPFHDGGNYYQPVGTYAFAHYWPYVSGEKEKSWKGDAYFLGPYNGDFNFFCNAVDKTSLKFTERPTPASNISTANYLNTDTKSWEFGISGGYEQMGDEKGFNVNANLGIGGSTSNTVNYSVSDVTITNNCNNNEVNYQMTYNNVPKKAVNIDDYIDHSKMPVSCRSTTDLSMAWEWTTSTPKDDYDESIQRLEFELQSRICIATRDTDIGSWHNYFDDFTREFVFHDDGDDSPMRLGRIPVGCLHIENKCTQGQMLFNICIKDEKDSTVAESVNSIAQGEYYEVLLPQKGHIYRAFLDLGKTRSDTKPYHSVDSTTLPLLISANDKKILSINDVGGDFETDLSLIRITNQSQLKLVRNIKVYQTSDQSVAATYPSSLGYSVTAEIYVKAGVEYYVTIEFGSSSSYDLYRSDEFTPEPYTAESKAQNLTVTVTGGDFIKM